MRYSAYEEALVPATELPSHGGWAIQGSIDHTGYPVWGVIHDSTDPSYKPAVIDGYTHVLVKSMPKVPNKYAHYFADRNPITGDPNMVRIGRSVDVTEEEFHRRMQESAE